MKTDSSHDAFLAYQQVEATAIQKAVEHLQREIQTRKNPTRASYPFYKVEQELLGVVTSILGVPVPNFQLQSPPSHVQSDFAIETFSLAKLLKQSPQVLAKKIADAINSANLMFVKTAEVTGPFVNVNLDKDAVYTAVVSSVQEHGEAYGGSDTNVGKTVFVDYSSPNVAKPIGVGHMRSTIIGQALANLYAKTGYAVVRDNHLGDWGTQFGKLVYAYMHWGNEERINLNPITELKDLYVRFHNLSKDNPAMEDDARKLFADLENGDSTLLAIWRRFRDLSIADFGRVYGRLGISFDLYLGESYFVQAAGTVVDECLKSGTCRIDSETGAVVVDGLGDLPSFLLRKSDGSTLYVSRDLASLKFRIDTFSPNVILYVVGSEQALNFQQMFAFARKIGYLDSPVEVKHIDFGMVMRDGKKMSTRGGTLIELEDLLAQSVSKSREVLASKNSDLTTAELDAISEVVGVGAVIYNDLRQSRSKNISFDWERMLNVEGGSAAYLQYTYVRILSILRKLTETFPRDASNLVDEPVIYEIDGEFALARKLLLFPQVVLRAQETDSPHDICTYLEELAALFNSFYGEASILGTENPQLRLSRTALIKSVAQVIKNGLAMMSVQVPEKM